MSNRPVVSQNKTRSYNGDYMEKGKIAERVVMAWLSDHPDVLGLSDVTQIAPLQRVDSDLIISLIDGTTPLAEIKHDFHLGTTPYMIFEVLRINHKAPAGVCAALGWSVRTQAEWILYYAPQQKQVWQIRSTDLRKMFQKYTEEKRKNTSMKWISTDQVKSTIICRVPLTYLSPYLKVHDVTEYVRGIDTSVNTDQRSMNFQDNLTEY